MGNQQLEDQLMRFGGGATSSTMTPATLALVLAAILLFFFVPRKYIIVPFLLVSIFIPSAQVVVIGGLHFMVLRLMLPFAWARVVGDKLLGHSNEPFRFGAIDKAIVLWALADTACATLLWGSWASFVNRVGFLYSVLGVYFLLRLLIRDNEDMKRTIRVLAIVCALVAVFMVREQLTGRNIFSVFGGVPEVTQIREGQLRSQAAFAHAILAGTIGATLLPVFVGLWWQGGKSKISALLGVLSSLIMVLTSASATPVLACLAGIAALWMWPFRRRLRLFRWGFVIGLISLHLAMKGPVWALIWRLSVVAGASGWHRFELINQAILHFGDWWLLGTRNPSNWGFATGDVSDAYVSAAVNGGLLTLILFLGILWQSFRTLGSARKAAERERKLEVMVWAFGAALFASVIAFFGIWYFDQTILVWYALLAMTCAVASSARVPVSESERTFVGPLWPLVERRQVSPVEADRVRSKGAAWPSAVKPKQASLAYPVGKRFGCERWSPYRTLKS